jgi:C1A family cysteine protease
MPTPKFKYATGYRIDPYDARDQIYLAPPRILPVKIDNREECTEIRDQGQEGSCVGHALCAVAEFLYWRKLGNPPNFSERWAYEKAKLNDEWPGENYEGTSPRGAIKAWAKLGLCEEKFWPYAANKQGKPKTGAGANAQKYPILKYERCLGLENIKHAIHHHGCVLMGMTVHGGWMAVENGMIPLPQGYEVLGGHAITFVGYDDQRQIFWLKNSWGADWGEDGFAGVSYQDCLVNIQDAWSVNIPD